MSDNIFADFDQQAEQLTGHDQSYLQLTPGTFHGRFLSAFLGDDVSVHIEYCNQSLEQEVGGSPDHISFGVILSEQEEFIVEGHALSRDDVFILPSSNHMHFTSPLNGVVMAISLNRCRFLAQPGLSPKASDWLQGNTDTVKTLRAPRLAHRLREDAICALENLSQTDLPQSGVVLGQALAASIASKLSLEWSSAASKTRRTKTLAYERFQLCRNWLSTNGALINGTAEMSDVVRASKRSVEQAFSENVSVGPLTYLRILRLHDVKRKLAEQTYAQQSIGDIAAEHGFWDWSRFSHHYRRHFGELPSETRQYRPSHN